jgi:hypothetical protein
LPAVVYGETHRPPAAPDRASGTFPWRVAGHPGVNGRSSRRGVIYRSLDWPRLAGPVVFEGDSVMSITKVPIWYRYLSGCPPLRRCRSTAAATDDNAVLAHVPGIRN